MNKPTYRKTEHGFEIIEFLDRYGEKCSIQQSSAALTEQPGAGAIWLGIDPERMHLDRERVCWLLTILHNWLNLGHLFSVDEQAQIALISGKSRCRKCGSDDTGCSYRALGDRVSSHLGVCEWVDSKYWPKGLLRYYCKNCGYEWNEHPLDEIESTMWQKGEKGETC